MFTLVGELPRHQYVWIDTTFTHLKPCGFVEAVWFGLVSMRGRVWGCTVMLKSGAIYRNLPVHALAFRSDPEPDWTPKDAQAWDCYGETFTALPPLLSSTLTSLLVSFATARSTLPSPSKSAAVTERVPTPAE